MEVRTNIRIVLITYYRFLNSGPRRCDF